MSTPAETAARLFQLVKRDPGLPSDVRRRASRLWATFGSNPDLAVAALDELSRRVAKELPRSAASTPLGRCVTVEVYWRFHLESHIQAFFVTPHDYRRHIEDSDDPARLLSQHLSESRITFPMEHSWLSPWDQIAGLDGATTQRRLRLGNPPPYVVFRLSRSSLQRNSVTIRRARSVDAVLGHHVEWDLAGPSRGVQEFIDGDIPRDAIEEFEWRR
jgi:hypothetical protein